MIGKFRGEMFPRVKAGSMRGGRGGEVVMEEGKKGENKKEGEGREGREKKKKKRENRRSRRGK